MNEDPYQSGWYPGQVDSPAKVAKEMKARGITKYLFGIDSVGQFETKWSCYVHKDEEYLLNPLPESENEEEEVYIETDKNVSMVAEVEKKHCFCKFCKEDLYVGEEY